MSRIVIDLPSQETTRRKGAFEWVRSLFGAKLDLRSGKEEITVGAFALVEAIAGAFRAAGVTDAISLVVDRHVVYNDAEEHPDDIERMASAASGLHVFDKAFKEMHVVFAHRTALLHALFDVRISREVLLGGAEMQVTISARMNEATIRDGESAKEYAERIKAFAAREASFEPGRQELDRITDHLAKALQRTLRGANVAVVTAVVQLVRPDAQQIARFSKLEFGDKAKSPRYRTTPTTRRHGAYSDPFYYYYYDPYYDYYNYYLIDSMIHAHTWHSPLVHVVDPHGTPLHTGDTTPAPAACNWAGENAVSFDAGGNVAIAPACEAAAAAAPAWSDTVSNDSTWSPSDPNVGSSDDSRHGSGWTDADTSSGNDSQSSCSSSSDTSTSSCGSSCSSGSSCGSSCGGGGD